MAELGTGTDSSGLLGGDDLTLAERLAIDKRALKTGTMMPNAVAAIAPSMAWRDPDLSYGAQYLPGAGLVEGIIGLGSYLGDKASALGNAALNAVKPEWGLHIPEPPEWMRKAGEHSAQLTADWQNSIDKWTGGALPKPDPTTPEGQVADIAGSAIGMGLGVTPGSWARTITGLLPRGTKTLGTMLMMPTGAPAETIPLQLGVATAQTAVDNAGVTTPVAGGQTTQPADPRTAVFGATQPPPTDATTQPDATAVAPTPPTPPPPTQVTPATDPRAVLFGAPASTTDQSDDPRAALFNQAAGPTFTQQGNTDTPLWKTGLGLLTGLALVAAGRRTHEMGTQISEAGREARFNDPAYAAKEQAYQADVISRGPNGTSLLPPGGSPTPAPTPQGNILHRGLVNTAQGLVNDTAQGQDYFRLTSADPAMAERLSAMYGNTYDARYQQDRTSNFLRTGHDEDTGITIPSMVDLLNDRASLPRDKADMLAEGLRAANEKNTRDWNRTQWKQAHPGEEPLHEDIAHDFIGHGTDFLDQKIAAMQADPQLAEMQERYKQIATGMPTIGEHPAYNFFSPSEAEDLRTIRPDYVPEQDINGRAVHPFGPRDTSAFTGQAQITSDPIRDMAAHVEQLYPQFARNRFNQEVKNHQMDNAQRVPGAAQSMTNVQAPTGAHASYYPTGGLPDVGGQARDPIVSVRTGTGVEYLRNDDPLTYHMMTNHSLGSARVALGAANTARRLYQQSTTGLGAAVLSGRITGIRTGIAEAIIGPLNAKPNMRAGLVDTALQRLSPGPRTTKVLQPLARGLDIPLNVPPVVASYFTGVGDRRIKNFADIFHPDATNIVNKQFRAAAGNAVVDAIHKMANDRWQQSTTRWLHEDLGITGAGSAVHLDAPGVVTGTRGGPFSNSPEGIRSLAANLAPRAYFSADWRGTKPFFISLRNAVGEALDHINDAGLDYSGRLNKNNPNISKEALRYNIRGLYGNPARQGSNRFVRGATSIAPWSNIAMQELGSTGSAIGRRPFGSAVTMATGLGSLAALEILTHMRSQAHMDFLQNQLSTQQREANVALAVNSDPTKPTMIPLPRSVRAGYAFMLDVMSKAINTVAAYHDPVTFNGVWEGLKDFLGGHITTSNAMAMQNAGADMFDFINPPPYLGHLDYHAMIQNGLANLPSAFHGVGSGPIDKTIPGEAPATMWDSKPMEIFKNILSNTLGAAAATVFNTTGNISRYQTQGHSFLDSVGMAGRDWLQTARESNMATSNMPWETTIRLSMRPPIAEALSSTLLNLKALPPMPKPSQAGIAGGRSPVPVITTGEELVSHDPAMINMLQIAHAYGQRIDQAMLPIKAIQAEMGSVSKYGMNPQDRREWLNQATRNMADHYKLVQAYTGDMYNVLSKLAGKPISNLGAIRWNQGTEQFR